MRDADLALRTDVHPPTQFQLPRLDQVHCAVVGAMIAAFQDLQRQLDGLVLVLHHTGKNTDQGLRGWSGLLGALDFSIECQFADGKDTDKLDRRFRIDKQKEGEDGRSFDFRMGPVLLAMDSDGDPITSLVVKQRRREVVSSVPVGEHHARHELVWEWIHSEVHAGRFPSGRSLDAQREAKHPEMSQRDLRDVLARLDAAGRVSHEGAGKKQWLRATELTPGGGYG